MGALDGKYGRTMAPPHSDSLYNNYKKFFSIILLALVNANYEFFGWTLVPMGHSQMYKSTMGQS